MLRIAVDARPLCSPINGIGRYTSRVLEELICNPLAATTWFLYADRPLLRDFSVFENVVTRTFRTANRCLSLSRSQCAFVSWATRDRVDTFWSPRHHLPLALPRNIQTVVTIHDLVWKTHPGTMQRANRLMESLLMPPSISRANNIICVSNATKHNLLKFFPSARAKCTVITEGPLPDVPVTLPRTHTTADPYFLFVGTLEPRKNLPRILQAFRGVSRLIGQNLVIVGAQGWGNKIGDIVSTLGLSDRVQILGHVDDERLGDLYRGATALILPSLHEGFGLTAVEAMHHGIPVIGSNAGALPEIIGNGGLLVDPTSIDEMSHAIFLMATDSHLRVTLSEFALDRSRSYSWHDAARRTFEVLRH